jgi:glutamate dehydrogenase
VLERAEDGEDADQAMSAWLERNAGAVERVRGILTDIRASRTFDMTTLPVALREVRNLVRTPASDA